MESQASWGSRLPHCSLAAERCSRSQPNLEYGAKTSPLDRESKLDQYRPARGDTGNHDHADGPDHMEAIRG
jgi:hypothetical protein